MRNWRFLEPLVNKCVVVFAGSHFQAGLPLSLNALSLRNIPSSKVEIIHAPTSCKLLEVAPSAHVVVPFMEHLDDTFFNSSSKLRLAIQYGVGLERVDLNAATAAGVAVSNIPADGTGNAEATSEHAILLSMSLLRHYNKSKFDGLSYRFNNQILGGLPVPKSLYRRNVTVVGYGSIGSVLCRYLVTMGANVTAVRKRCWSLFENGNEHVDPWSAITEKIKKASSLEEALPETDLLILACEMNPQTFHLINRETISLLPQGALIVNIGRGPLVEYNAISDALKSGHVEGFASDVGVGHPSKTSEPWDPQDDLSKLDNVIFTPHVGGYCDYSYGYMANKIVDGIEAVVSGNPPPVWVNKDHNI